MKKSVLVWTVLSAALAACSTPASRIRGRQAEFDAYPPAVQQAIRAGRAEVGFTPEQVTLAFGRPERVYTRNTPAAAQEIWVYGDVGGPRFGLGFGMGRGGYGYSSSLGVESGYYEGGVRRRVVFEAQRVVSVEDRLK